MKIILKTGFLLSLTTLIACHMVDDEDDLVFQAGSSLAVSVGVAKESRYFLYDVNHGEGFNLRRDVYMRIANLVHNLVFVQQENWILVLPPWGPLYHWKSKDVEPQVRLQWSNFFDLGCLNKHVPVIEFEDYLAITGKPEIEEVYYLQHYAEGWDEGKWEEKMDERPCIEKQQYFKDESGVYRGWFWGHEDVYARSFKCISVQGESRTLKQLLHKTNARSLLVDRAETVLHDMFGDALYWKARRSMRFAKHLREAADAFRRKFLNSTDENDRTVLADDWTLEKRQRIALGGPYLAAHLRRADFLYGHKDDVPSIENAARQLIEALHRLNLTTLFIATDATSKEVSDLTTYMGSYKTFRFTPSREDKVKFKDGGVAIIDQWICSHARHFIGTHESTFSYRIQEEREILGFHLDTTFNRLCSDGGKCEQPARWKIVYD